MQAEAILNISLVNCFLLNHNDTKVSFIEVANMTVHNIEANECDTRLMNKVQTK